jgi:hypothetical protein
MHSQQGRLAPETVEKRESSIQQVRLNQQRRLTAETAEQREAQKPVTLARREVANRRMRERTLPTGFLTKDHGNTEKKSKEWPL